MQPSGPRLVPRYPCEPWTRACEVHLFATPAEIAEAYAGCLAEAEADVLARLRWIMHGPELVLYKELFAATSVYAGDVRRGSSHSPTSGYAGSC